eukprot:1989275-Rhodomonas_salina.2
MDITRSNGTTENADNWNAYPADTWVDLPQYPGTWVGIPTLGTGTRVCKCADAPGDILWRLQKGYLLRRSLGVPRAVAKRSALPLETRFTSKASIPG